MHAAGISHVPLSGLCKMFLDGDSTFIFTFYKRADLLRYRCMRKIFFIIVNVLVSPTELEPGQNCGWPTGVTKGMAAARVLRPLEAHKSTINGCPINGKGAQDLFAWNKHFHAVSVVRQQGTGYVQVLCVTLGQCI